MNRDPERLMTELSDDTLDAELVRSLRAMSPPAGAREAGWASLSKELATLGLAASVSPELLSNSTAAPQTQTATKIATTTGSKASALKWVLGVGLGGAAAAATVWSLNGEQSLERKPQSTATTEATAQPALSRPALSQPAALKPPGDNLEPASATLPKAELPKAELPKLSPPLPKPEFNSRTAPVVSDALTRETSLLIEARSKLRGGDTSAAAASLDELDTRFPGGRLTQEREVLRIELQAAKGDRKGAAQRARAFQIRYPKSPHSAALSRFLDPR